MNFNIGASLVVNTFSCLTFLANHVFFLLLLNIIPILLSYASCRMWFTAFLFPVIFPVACEGVFERGKLCVIEEGFSKYLVSKYVSLSLSFVIQFSFYLKHIHTNTQIYSLRSYVVLALRQSHFFFFLCWLPKFYQYRSSESSIKEIIILAQILAAVPLSCLWAMRDMLNRLHNMSFQLPLQNCLRQHCPLSLFHTLTIQSHTHTHTEWACHL